MTNNFNEETSLEAENISRFMVAIAVLISVVNVFSEWNYIEIKNIAWKTWVLNIFIIYDFSGY